MTAKADTGHRNNVTIASIALRREILAPIQPISRKQSRLEISTMRHSFHVLSLCGQYRGAAGGGDANHRTKTRGRFS
jgi:hypothetical protein